MPKEIPEIRARLATPDDNPRYVFTHEGMTLYSIPSHLESCGRVIPNPEWVNAPYSVKYLILVEPK